jgi:hypothetical protein|tara:strand:+ start:331 stop:1272 length:942 start_codon:yes stop_codon:yes gene_type:complete
MIKLKDLLMESTYAPSKQAGPSWIDNKWYPAHTKAVLNWVRQKDVIPLTPSVVEKALGRKIPVKSFHITGPDGIRQLKYVLNRKKTISTFTATHEDESLAKGRGVQTGMGGIICYVEGHLLAKKSMDFDTVPDKQGRRWVSAYQVFDGKPTIWYNALDRANLDYDSVDRKISDIEREYHDRWMDLPSSDPNHLEYNEYKEQAKKAVGPVVAKYVKDYIDVANKTLLKNKKLFKKSLIDSRHNKRTSWWNELLVYDTKIIDMFVMQRVLDKNTLAKVEIEKLLSTASGNKPITIGTPVQFRKWFTERKGKIHKD